MQRIKVTKHQLPQRAATWKKKFRNVWKKKAIINMQKPVARKISIVITIPLTRPRTIDHISDQLYYT